MKAAFKKKKVSRKKILLLPQMWNRVWSPTPNSRTLQKGKAWMKVGPEPGFWIFVPNPRVLGQSRKAVGTSVPPSGPRIRAGGPPGYVLARQPEDQPFQMLLLLLTQSQPRVFNVPQIQIKLHILTQCLLLANYCIFTIKTEMTTNHSAESEEE